MTSETDRRKAQSNKAKSANKANNWKPSDFVECNMGKEEKDAFRSNHPHPEEVADWLDRMMRDGYKLSISFSEKYDSYNAFLTCMDPQDKNYNLCLSGRAAGYLSALAVLFFKHTVMLDGVWANTVDREFEPDRLG